MDEETLRGAEAEQLQVVTALPAAGDALAGWKLGMTSGSNRDGMGAGVRPFGHLLESRRFADGASIERAPMGDAGIEPELGFLFQADLQGPDVTRGQVLEAIAGAVPCFELVVRALPADATDAQKVVGNLSQWGVVVGTPVPWPGSTEQLEVELRRDGELVARSGPGYPIDDPIDSVRRLCVGLSAFGLGITAGQHVITGAFSKARIDGPSAWSANFSGIGGVSARFV